MLALPCSPCSPPPHRRRTLHPPIQNVLPELMAKLSDDSLRSFVEQCLQPATSRPTAAHLMSHPFMPVPDGAPLRRLDPAVPCSFARLRAVVCVRRVGALVPAGELCTAQ